MVEQLTGAQSMCQILTLIFEVKFQIDFPIFKARQQLVDIFINTNIKHTYSHIDDENIKIAFSKELLQAAKKKKFDLPQPSVNIIYENDE